MLPESTAKDLLRQAADTVEVPPLVSGTVAQVVRRRRRSRFAIAAGSAAAAAIVAGATLLGGAVENRPAPAPAGPSENTTPSQQPGRSASVPILVKYPEDVAVQRVEEWGFTAEVVHRFEPCRPAGSVVDQEPRAGSRVAAGSVVTVVVAGQASDNASCPRGVSFADDRAVASALYDFSRGAPEGNVPWAPSVTLSVLEGAMHRTLTERQAAEREQWRVTVISDDFRHEIDVLGELAHSAGEYRVDVGPQPDCVGPKRPSASMFEGLRQIRITPTASRDSCLDWWALDVFHNDVGQIQGVVLHRWEW